MKRVIALMVLLTILLTVFGCARPADSVPNHTINYFVRRSHFYNR
jgi:predicted small lipoprotein YifL